MVKKQRKKVSILLLNGDVMHGNNFPQIKTKLVTGKRAKKILDAQKRIFESFSKLLNPLKNLPRLQHFNPHHHGYDPKFK